MSIVFLRVKIKSLAVEAAIIRREERKSGGRTRQERKLFNRRPGSLWDGLNHHRRHDVRREARAALLAYGFLRGRPYASIEAKTHCSPDRARVVALVRKYGPPGAHMHIDAWFAGTATVVPEAVRRSA